MSPKQVALFHLISACLFFSVCLICRHADAPRRATARAAYAGASMITIRPPAPRRRCRADVILLFVADDKPDVDYADVFYAPLARLIADARVAPRRDDSAAYHASFLLEAAVDACLSHDVGASRLIDGHADARCPWLPMPSAISAQFRRCRHRRQR